MMAMNVHSFARQGVGWTATSSSSMMVPYVDSTWDEIRVETGVFASSAWLCCAIFFIIQTQEMRWDVTFNGQPYTSVVSGRRGLLHSIILHHHITSHHCCGYRASWFELTSRRLQDVLHNDDVQWYSRLQCGLFRHRHTPLFRHLWTWFSCACNEMNKNDE